MLNNLHYDKCIRRVLNDPASSYWLKRAVEESAQRDPIDALRDAEHLALMLKIRVEELAMIHAGGSVASLTESAWKAAP